MHDAPPLRLHQAKWPSLIFERRPVMLYICTKFCEIILNDIKVIERTWFPYWKLQRGIILQKDTISILTIYKITKGHKTEKNVEGVTVQFTIKVWSYFYLYQVSWNYLKRYQSYRADTISMPEVKKGNNSAKNISGVTSFNLCKMAGHSLHLYQVSWNYLERYQSYIIQQKM